CLFRFNWGLEMFKNFLLVALLCVLSTNTYAFFGPKIKSDDCHIKLDKNSYISPRSSIPATDILELKLLGKNFSVLGDSSDASMRVKISVDSKVKFRNA